MMEVKDFMYKDITAVNDNANLYRVITIMHRNRVCAVPILTRTGDYISCISEEDILAASAPNYMSMIKNTYFMADMNKILYNLNEKLNTPAIDYVDSNYPVVKCSDKVTYAIELMYRYKKTVIPVLENNQLVGTISRIDILSAGTNSTKK